MNEDTPFVHDYTNVTTLHPIGLAAVIVLGTAMVLLPRRWAIMPMLIMACFVAPAQRIAIVTLDFNLLRIMVLFGWSRLLLRNEFRGFRWHPIDYVLLAWTITGTAAYTFLRGDVSALVFKLGMSFDAVGMYFLFRCLVRDWSDVDRFVRGVAVISIPVAIAFIIEWTTRRNMFAIFGGVSEITAVRDGKLRCQGAYAHPILAGCFWATLLPLILALFAQRGMARVLALTGTACALLVIVACASSTPIAAVGAVALGMAMFPARRWMRLIRWGILGMLIGLHLAMKAPVWHLISRIDLVGGSTGWHRYHLIDQAIKRFGEWWLLGTKSTMHWGHELYDVTNQYVLEGVRGGVATLILFVASIALAFGGVGRLWRIESARRPTMWLAWAMGVALFTHVMIFLAVSYFGQIIVLWYLLLAMIASLDPGRRASMAAPVRAAARRRPPNGRGFAVGAAK